jgi:hypothetical protein
VMSFGEDEAGEVYFMTDKGTLHRFGPVRRDRAGAGASDGRQRTGTGTRK